MPARSTWPTRTTRTATSSRTCIKSTRQGQDLGRTSPATCPSAAACTPSPRTTSNPNLLFAGTEFGLYFTKIGGEKWIKLNVGLPTIMVRDLAIQKQMDDLVIGTFGRSIYVLDDYSPLRIATPELLQKDSALFPVKTALSYLPISRRAANAGEEFFTAPNPPVGAAITFNLKDGLTTKRAERQRRERAAIQRGETPPYPTPEQLRAEAEEEAPAIIVSIADASGKVVRRFDAPATRGLHRVTWDLRLQSTALAAGDRGRRGGGGGGVVVAAARRWRGGGGGGGGEEEVGVRRARRRPGGRWRPRQVHRDAGQAAGRRDHAAPRIAIVRSGGGRSRPPKKTGCRWRSSRTSSPGCKKR